MQCPSEITEIVCAILQVGLIRIRALGWNVNPGGCVVEADHLHNLPVLLSNYKPELLDFYWNIERPTFIQQGTGEDIAQFEPLWQALAEHVEAKTNEVVSVEH